MKARKEVIVAGGSINSPQLLLLSGIGPKKHLKDMKIPVVHDLPGVGENLHNHQSFGIDYVLNEPYFSQLNVDSVNQYLQNQTGPLSGTGMAQITGILRSRYAEPDDPDIQIFFAGYQAICQSKIKVSDLGVAASKTAIRMTSVNLQPTSRGKFVY